MAGIIRYKTKIIEVTEIECGESVLRKRVVIMEELTENGLTVELPSCLTKYLYDQFRNCPISNAKNAADVICPFLNYIKFKVLEEDEEIFEMLPSLGLYGLTFYHIANYINFCILVKKISRKTANQYTDQLMDFYEYLVAYNLVDHNKVKFQYKTIKGGPRKGKKSKFNPFKKAPYKIHYPSYKLKDKSKINNMEEELWQLFLQTSQKFAPDITLGVAFQMFGGLRRGEVVNLILNAVKLNKSNREKNDESRMLILIRNRQVELFNSRDNIDLSKCGVKKERDQQVINFNGRLYDYFKNHMDLRNKILDKTGSVTNALFVDEKGLPMSGEKYQRRWAKVKREFLKVLDLNAYGYYVELAKENSIWGTHIGRGIFSNLCLIYGLAKTSDELKNWRGDTHPDSSKPYVDAFKVSGIIIKSLNFLSKDVKGV